MVQGILLMVEMTLGQRIKALREKKGWSKYRLGKEMGMHQGYVDDIEKDMTPNPGIFTIKKFADVLGTDLNYLMGYIDYNVEERARKTIAEIDLMLKEAKINYMENPSILEELPFLGNIPCGTPFPEEQQNGETVRVPKIELGDFAGRKDLYTLRASGDSLEGDGIYKGQYLVVLPEHSYLGKRIYIVRLGNSVIARHVEKTKEGKYRLKASNNHYQDMEPSEVELLGMVITWGGWKNGRGID